MKLMHLARMWRFPRTIRTAQVARKVFALIAIVVIIVPVLYVPNVAEAGSQEFTSSGTFTVPAGVTIVTVEVIGGGGGGSQTCSGAQGGGGGGAGAYAKKTVSVTPGAGHTVTIGAGGGSHVNGGVTSVGSLLSANGGAASLGDEVGGSCSGGAGGAVTGGADTSFKGGNGGTCSGSGTHGGGGGGGGGRTGAGGNSGGCQSAGTGNSPGGNGGINGNNGSLYGGGGSGRSTTFGYAAGSGAKGYALVTWDSTAPTPNPMTFASVPNDTATSSIAMTATTASDPLGGIEYLFTFAACAADGGTGGTSSSWQGTTSYTDTGLQVNQCYGYTVKAHDANENTTSASAASEAYTTAATPGTPTFSVLTETTASIVNDENGNPSANPTTTFAVQIVNSSPNDATWEGKYVDANGDPSASAVWLSDAAIEALTVSGLTAGTTYEAKVKARNGDGDETAFSGTDGTTTLEASVRAIRLLGNVRLRGVRLR